MKRELPTLQINWSQVLTSLVVGAILGAFTLLRLSDSQTVVLAGHTKTIEKLENSTVSLELFKLHNESQTQQFKSIDERLYKMDSKIDQLLLKH